MYFNDNPKADNIIDKKVLWEIQQLHDNFDNKLSHNMILCQLSEYELNMKHNIQTMTKIHQDIVRIFENNEYNNVRWNEYLISTIELVNTASNKAVVMMHEYINLIYRAEIYGISKKTINIKYGLIGQMIDIITNLTSACQSFSQLSFKSTDIEDKHYEF
jgi:hypothetical protein